MTRTIQTALIVFGHLLLNTSSKTELQVWPDLREAHDAICNKGVSHEFDFSACREEWDYPPHSPEDAIARAESVRQRLKDLSGSYENIVLILHRGFIAFLFQGDRFDVCECRSYQFATEEELSQKRYGTNCDTGGNQDYGPSLLLPFSPLPAEFVDGEVVNVDKEDNTVTKGAVHIGIPRVLPRPHAPLFPL